MEDWLPSERSARSGGRQAPTRTMPSHSGIATDERRSDGRGGRLTETLGRMSSSRPQASRPTHRLVRRDLMVRRVDPWTVLKLSLVFYSCMLIIVMLANAVLWAFISRLGLIDQVTRIAGALNISLVINTGNILQATFLLGVLGVVFASAVNVFFAFLYNLVADLIGGIRIDLAEDE